MGPRPPIGDEISFRKPQWMPAVMETGNLSRAAQRAGVTLIAPVVVWLLFVVP